jgi:hypothetical protein
MKAKCLLNATLTLVLAVAGLATVNSPVATAAATKATAARPTMNKEKQYVEKLKAHAAKTGKKELLAACLDYETATRELDDLERQDRAAYRESDAALMAAYDASQKYEALVDQSLSGQANFDKVKDAWIKYQKLRAEYTAKQAAWGKVRQALEAAHATHQAAFAKVMNLSGN